jgi:hypothetical protein
MLKYRDRFRDRPRVVQTRRPRGSGLPQRGQRAQGRRGHQGRNLWRAEVRRADLPPTGLVLSLLGAGVRGENCGAGEAPGLVGAQRRRHDVAAAAADAGRIRNANGYEN